MTTKKTTPPNRQSVNALNLLTTKQVAEKLGVCRQRICQMSRVRHIEPVRIGTSYLWRFEDLPKFVRRPSGRPKKVRH